MNKVTPNLWFDGDAEQAVDRYTGLFDESSVGRINRYDEAMAQASGQPEGSAMTVAFELEGQAFVALNGGDQFPFNPSVSFIVNCSTVEEVDHLWAELSAGGHTHMPLDSYPFSERYGWTDDEYGVSWQLILAEDDPEQRIVPSLMFVGDQVGNAEPAIEFYTAVFDGQVLDIARYGPDQSPDDEGTVMYANFTLCDQQFAAMDSAQDHDFAFNEAISFVVDCDDQEEVDYYWEALLADGGNAGQCAWLKDRYGVSWQIVPQRLPELLEDPDAEKASRVADAMLQMQKIDIETLERAAAG